MNRVSIALACSLLVLWSLASGFAQQAPEVVRGGTVVAAITADPPGWDPSASNSQEIARVVYHNVLQGLVRIDRHGQLVPSLASGWQVSADGLTWTFDLRQGVRFHDGSTFGVADVLAKFAEIMDPDSGHVNQGYFAAVERVEAVGDQQVLLHLAYPARSLLYNLARPEAVIFPAARTQGRAVLPIGTGPFRFAHYLEGSEVRLEAFRFYWDSDLPYLDAAVFRIIADPNTRYAAVQTGDVDLLATSVPPEQLSLVRRSEVLKSAVGTATAEIVFAMNNARPPFDDIRVRQAITHAIDKDAIVRGAMFGHGTVIGSHMSPSEGYYLDLSGTYPYDPARARELLAEAGHANGLRFSFELPEPYNLERRTGEVIAQQLRAVGITVDLSVVEWGTWIERIFLGSDYDTTIIGHVEPRDIDVYANPDYYYRYDNPRVAELLLQAETATSDEAETAAYQEIARTIADDAVNVWVFSPPYVVIARQDIHGFWTDQPTTVIDMTEVYRAP